MTGRAAATRAVTCGMVTGPDELAEHHRIRHAVFVGEQGLFPGSDVDAVDARPDVLRVLAFDGDEPVGTVRLYPLDAGGLWRGDRLAVLPGRRAAGAGAPLVRFAVATAGRLGGHRMLAHVQVPNRGFFERLGWTAAGTETYAGLPHLAMTIALPRPAPDGSPPDGPVPTGSVPGASPPGCPVPEVSVQDG